MTTARPAAPGELAIPGGPVVDGDRTAREFIAHRTRLYSLAYRLLGSVHDAEDVLQEAYLRWTGADRSAVEMPRRYLTRVVARLAIDHLRARGARREHYVGEWLPEPVSTQPSPFGAVDTSDLSLAVLHLMERLTPPQRAVYVLRTAFDVPYAEIATIVDRSEADCRQLHRRAAAAIGADRPKFTPTRDEHRRLLHDFVAAARDGDLARLEGMLAAEAVTWSDGGGRAPAARRPVSTPVRIARFFAGIYSRHETVRLHDLEVNGRPAYAVDNPKARHILVIEAEAGLITTLFVITNPEKIDGPWPSGRWSEIGRR